MKTVLFLSILAVLPQAALAAAHYSQKIIGTWQCGTNYERNIDKIKTRYKQNWRITYHADGTADATGSIDVKLALQEGDLHLHYDYADETKWNIQNDKLKLTVMRLAYPNHPHKQPTTEESAKQLYKYDSVMLQSSRIMNTIGGTPIHRKIELLDEHQLVTADEQGITPKIYCFKESKATGDFHETRH